MSILTFYRLATITLTPFARPALNWRAKRGKEDPERLDERLGVASLPRPSGRLVWLHGASLGESLSLLPLIDRFIQRGVEVLVTSGTYGSARLLAERLPAGPPFTNFCLSTRRVSSSDSLTIGGPTLRYSPNPNSGQISFSTYTGAALLWFSSMRAYLALPPSVGAGRPASERNFSAK